MNRGFITTPLVVALAVVFAGGIGYLASAKKSNVPTAGVLTMNEERIWKNYTNATYNYRIQYPSIEGKVNYREKDKWVYEEFGDVVGFGPPSSQSGGYFWTVAVYDKNVADVSKMIAQIGNQFSDRKESRLHIQVASVPALLVTVTTKQADHWIHKAVYVEHNNKIYVISNGAIDYPDFVRFYNSFRFILE